MAATKDLYGDFVLKKNIMQQKTIESYGENSEFKDIRAWHTIKSYPKFELILWRKTSNAKVSLKWCINKALFLKLHYPLGYKLFE